MFFAVAGERGGFGALRGFHGHEKLFFARAGGVEGGEAGGFDALYACALADVADRAFLQRFEIE